MMSVGRPTVMNARERVFLIAAVNAHKNDRKHELS